MKKILYVVSVLQDKPNSVGNILDILLSQISDRIDVQQVVALEWGNIYGTSVSNNIRGYKTYVSKEYRRPVRFLMRVQRKLAGKAQIIYNAKHVGNIIDEEKPDLVVFFVLSPELHYLKLCKKKNIPYVYMLYDTYIARPDLNVDEAFHIEKQVIDNSSGYFVPRFFCEDYFMHYGADKITPYDLPLLIPKDDVCAAYQRNVTNYEYTYFGQIQSFRNADKIQELCKKLGISMDVFASDPIVASADSVFRIHPGISGGELYDVVAHSRFLVAFDNSAPYNHYLPSKVYLYVSFTKPVIAFGDNEDSSLIEFFKDYPWFYYQNINEDLSGLVEFIKKCNHSFFDENLYSCYTRFLPDNAMAEIKETIINIL